MKKISTETIIELYKIIFKIRCFEEKICSVYSRQDMKTPVHLCIGQEAIAAGICLNLNDSDYLFSTHRGHGHYIAKRGNLTKLVAELYGRREGCSSARGGSMHLSNPEKGMPGFSAIVGGTIPVAVGAALSIKLKKENKISAVFFGDGAADEGIFYESLNFAALKQLPVLFVCENNFYATASNFKARFALDNLPEKAKSFGIESVRLDGNDAVSIYETAEEVIDKMRKDHKPRFIECRTYRWKGHVGPEEDYLKNLRPEQELIEWKKKCPLKKITDILTNEYKINTEDINEKIQKEIDDAFDELSNFTEPDINDLYSNVFSED